MRFYSCRVALLVGSACAVFAQGASADPGTLPAGPDGNAAAAQSTPTVIPPVAVSATTFPLTPSQQLQDEGTAAAGYKVDTVQNVGPLGSLPLQDTPYSVSVMPLDMINNVQALTPDQLFKMNPATQVYLLNSRGGETDVNIRGFADPAVTEDGLRSSVFRMDLEDKERVEILEGLTSFLYGPDNPGGTINYVLKRPTPYRLDSITVGDAGGASGYIHGDFGGPLDPAGRFGYRLNIVTQDGDGVVDDSRLRRALFSGAFDAHLTPDLLLQLDASYSSYHENGIPPTWIFVPGVLHPSAPDNSKDWGQAYTQGDDSMAKGGGTLTYHINDAFTWRSAVKLIDEHQYNYILANNLALAPGSYEQLIFRNSNVENTTTSAYSFLDAKFRTGLLEHKITMGFFGDIANVYQPPDRNFTAPGFPGLSFAAPTAIPEPDLPVATLSTVKSNHLEHSNFTIGDDVKLGSSWSALLGVSEARIIDQSWAYTEPGAPESASYDRSKITPAASLIYKPIPQVSTYVTYIQGLEEGGVAPDTAANAFDVLPPLTSEEYEVGVKATIGKALATASLFRIERPNQFLDPADNVYKEAGDEVHQGLEVDLSGKVLPDLTLWGGVTVMQSRVANAQATPALDGKRPIGIGGVADQLAKLYAEYAIDAVPGLVLTGGVYYTGSFYSDAMNTDKLPGYVTEDIGARYSTRLYNTPTVFRLNVTNLSGQNYWLSSEYLGTPRTVLFSVETTF